MIADRPSLLRWQGASLATQYALASGVILTVAGFLVGTFIAARIEENVVRNSANSTAMFMESVLSPISQELADADSLGHGAQQALEEIFLNTNLADRVVSYKIWKRGGVIVAASDPALVGRSFPVTGSLAAAWTGKVSAEFGTDGEEEDMAEEALGLPLLEIYSPIRKDYTGEIIAVAEFYELHEQLEQDLSAARRDAWLAVIGAISLLGFILYLIVLRGSRMITRQQRDLERQFSRLETMSRRNRILRDQVRDAAGRAAEAQERSLRQIGADLHDGPAQQLAYAALHLDGMRDLSADDASRSEIDNVERAMSTAMSEIRAISRGLALPEVAGKSPATVVAMAVDEHRGRTGHTVELDIGDAVDAALPMAVNICLYRFVQEGLNNASRHAGGLGMAVTLACDGANLTLRVADQGPGIRPTGDRKGLGLSGLRDRVESLGGRFEAGAGPDGGGQLTLAFDLREWT